MNKYEVMFIVKPDLSEEEKKNLFDQIGAVITKHEGKISDASVWADKKKLFFPLKRFTSGLYYLVNCVSPAHAISRMSHEFRLNEGILRFMFTSL